MEFFLWQSTPVQPIAFNHRIHIQHGMQCTSCHSGATQGPDVGIPSANFCMACHQVIAADNPQIKKLAAYAAKGQDVPWQRVFWFYPSEHVQFWHAPHVRAVPMWGLRIAHLKRQAPPTPQPTSFDHARGLACCSSLMAAIDITE